MFELFQDQEAGVWVYNLEEKHSLDMIVFAFYAWRMARAFSRNKITFLRSRANFRLILDSTSSRMLKSIQALGWLEYEQGDWEVSLIIPKQRGFFYLPITIGFSLPPAALTKNVHVTLSFDFFPPVHCFDTSDKDLFGGARKNCPVSSMLKMFSGSSRSRYSVSALAVSPLKPPASPPITLLLLLNLFLNLSSHLLDTVNSESPSSSLARLAFSCNIGPVTGMSLILAFWYHSYVASSIFCVWDALTRLASAFLFALYSSNISVLLAKIDWICNFP